MNTMLSLGLLSFALTAATACASSSASDAALGSAASQATAARPAADLSGTWAFALAWSDVAAPLRDKCAKSSGNDAAKAESCWREMAAEAALEKIRFESDGSGGAVWTSFGVDGSNEVVFLQVPVELSADGPRHVLAKAKSSTNVMRIEVIDARTIAMTDPKKGRLVYTKE